MRKESSTRPECARIFDKIWKEYTDPSEIEKRKIKENREKSISYEKEDLGL